VDKELYGDTFRRPPRLTPLEARAIRLALEFVGPMIAARAHTPLDRVRAKLEETFGQFPLAQASEPAVLETEEDNVSILSRGANEHRLVSFEYLKEGEAAPSSRLVEPYSLERDLPFWRVHTWDRAGDGPRTFRLDRIKGARLLDETFDPRPDYDPQAFRDAGTARVRYTGGEPARRAVERWGATLLRDGSAVAELKFGSKEWIVGEVLAWRGDAVVIEPADLRRELRDRAKTLAQELGVSRLRVKT
jgi:proteasome accessory factor C